MKVSTTVSIDFTDGKNKDAREKFERVFINKAKAKSGKFEYKAQTGRRRLAQGTIVSVTLEYDDDASAEAGQQIVSASTFMTQVAEELKTQSVDITLSSTSADIEEVEQTVVVQVLVDESEDANQLGDAPYKPMVSFAIVLAAIAALC